MGIRSAVENIGEERALEYLKRYYTSGLYTGAHFESLVAGENLPGRFTAADLYAVSTLSVTVPVKAGIEILGSGATVFNGLLEEIPTTRISELSKDDFTEHLGPGSPAIRLWDLLRRNTTGQARWGIGPTTASKIMARKRPHLIPIQDSVVDVVIERGKGSGWKLWWEALSGDDALEQMADRLRREIDRPHLSTLRVFDVVLWMEGKSRGVVSTPDDEVTAK